MIRRLHILGCILLVQAAACSDVATRPEQSPSGLRVDRDLVTTSVGEVIEFQVNVLDQHGQIMTIPDWAPVQWGVSTQTILEPVSAGVRGIGPGAAVATARVAGLERDVTIRVNPTHLRLQVDSVTVTQEGVPGPQLEPNRPALVKVFLVGDQVNFFRPIVRASLIRDGRILDVIEMARPDESVPLSYGVHDQFDGWSTTIPGALIQPGVEMIIEVDPHGVIPRAAGSSDRFPASGSLVLDVGVPAVRLRIRGVHLNQSVQTFNGEVPIVADRDALLRVFLTTDDPVPYPATVHAHFYRGAVLVRSMTLSRAEPIPTQIAETLLESSWNAHIPGSWLEPGLSIVVEADGEGAFTFTDDSEPRFPSSGVLSLDIREVPPLWARLVPIHQAALGVAGDIGNHNLSTYLEAVTTKFPVSGVDADVRSVYYTTALANSDNGWVTILREIDALRVADRSGRYYYGVLRIPTGSPYAGIAFVGGLAGVGYDEGRAAAETFAHELGHNFSLRHAPCGGPSGVDPLFPYAGASIGVVGYDLLTGRLKLPGMEKDLMSYCEPEWISDYHYVKTMDYRDRWDWTTTGPEEMPGVEPALLIWGGIGPEGLVLEPAFELEMAPALPPGSGAYRIDGFDEQGSELFSYHFDPVPVDHVAGAASFAWAIPSRIAQPERLVRLRLSGPSGESVRVRDGVPIPSGGSEGVSAERRPEGLALSWNATAPMALIRNRKTGQVISFARGGAVIVADRDVEVILSDGVRSTTVVPPIR